MTDTHLTPRLGLRTSRGAALALLSGAMFTVVLTGSMVNLAASTIRSGLALTPSELTFVANSYLITVAGLMLLGGRLADVLGGRRMFTIGMSTYVAASALAAVATSGPMLIVARIGQGLGAAVAIPAALALVLLIYTTASERARALGVWGAVTAAGSLVGVFAGGMLTEALGWRAVFWTPVALGIAVLLVVWRAIPPTAGTPGRFDLAGAVSITAGVTALALGAVDASEIGWTSPLTLLALGAGAAGIVAFVAIERRSRHPLVPLTVFRRIQVSRATVVMMLVGGTLSGLFFFLPLYQQEALGMGALATGLTQVPIAIMLIVGSATAPLSTALLGLPRALTASLAVLLGGLLWIAAIPAASFTWQHLGAFLAIGLGLGLALVNGMTMAVRDSGAGESGLLSGLVNAAQALGGAIGLAVLAGLALTVSGTLEMSYTAAFLGAAALTSLALAFSMPGVFTARRDSLPTP